MKDECKRLLLSFAFKVKDAPNPELDPFFPFFRPSSLLAKRVKDLAHPSSVSQIR